MTCESFERSTGRCRKRGGSGRSIEFLHGRKRVLVMVAIMVLLLTSVVPLISLNPIDADYPGTKYTVVYHKNDGSGNETTVEVEYHGSFVSTEYNPQFWNRTVIPSGGLISQEPENWTNGFKVFTGWSTKADGSDHVDPGDILDLDEISPDGTIHLYAKWDRIVNQVTINSNDTYWDVQNKLSNITSDGDPYTNIININGTISDNYILNLIFGKSVTIRGNGSNSQIDIGDSDRIIGADVIIDQIKLIGSHKENHGDGSGGLFANGHKLIIGTRVDTGNSDSVTGYPQLFGGGIGNIRNTSLIREFGTPILI